MQQVNLVRDFFDKVLCGQHVELLADMTTEDVVCVAPQAVDLGSAAVRRSFEGSAHAFQFLKVDVVFAAELGSRVVAKVHMFGVQSGTYAGIRPSGRRVSLPCVYLFEFAGDRIRKIEVYYDVQLLTSQIGNGQTHYVR